MSESVSVSVGVSVGVSVRVCVSGYGARSMNNWNLSARLSEFTLT